MRATPHESARLGRLPTGSLRWAVDAFLLDCRARDLSEETIDFYRRRLRPLIAYLAGLGLRRITELQLGHVQTYVAGLRTAGQSTSNIHAHGRAIKAFLSWCSDPDNGLIGPEVARGFRLPKLPKIVREAFSSEQLSALVAAAAHTASPERDIALLLLMADTGIRAGEVGRIRDEELDFDRSLVHGKGRRERWVYLSPTTRKAITRWRKVRGKSEWLFLTARDEAMTRQTVYKLFRRLGEVTGISPCHPHMMRRTTAVEWIRAGGDTFTLQELLGHSSQSMSRIYVELASGDVQDAHRRVSLVERLKRRGRGQ